MFLLNAWYVVATSDEVGRSLLPRRICGEPVVLFRTESGSVAAFEDRCPHRMAALSAGRIVGDTVQCGYHGFRFDTTGACVEIPSASSIPRGFGCRVYPVVERHKWIWAWMGNPAKADPASIPDCHWNDSPDWAGQLGYTYVKADYRLLVDNLLDLTHLTFVHKGSIGSDDVAKTPVHTAIDGNRVTVSRVGESVPAPAMFRKLYGLDVIGRWSNTTFEPPSYLIVENGRIPAGAKDRSTAMCNCILNAITPETETSTHYFWTGVRSFDLSNAELTKSFHDFGIAIFDEDKSVIESQQERISSERTGRGLVNMACDAAGAAARRIVESLITAERAISD